ncbi:thioesterase family protein [Spongiibacter taiwanensis]|uniref:acyl-CoA thioesterase n=1 Tax=Spongiibacter taiwanensis TaxID=1748242 RepID=UPI0020360A54|nr:thioesterase family protein [Spongiibacter taiwanensis]USA44008.1 thioesterase family protein [Spongiibacter taiwanensis]
MMGFEQIIASVKPREQTSADETLFDCAVDASWLQGRTVFGGLSAALLTKALSEGLPMDRRLRSLSVNFVGPTPASGLDIASRPLRDGGSVSHRYGEIRDGDSVTANATAAFCKDRPSTISEPSPTRPSVAAVQDCPALPWIEGITPNFTQHFEMRLASGGWPFANAATSDYAMWIRFREPGAIDLFSLIAIADVPPIPGLNRLAKPSNGSSLSWYLECPSALPAQQRDDWWLVDYRCQSASHGYFHNHALVWAPDGQLALISRQLATVFEK